MLLRKLFISSIVALICAMLASQVHAEEINLSVNGNGDGASNNIQTQVDNNVTVAQSNNAEIANNTNSTTDTGNNQASSNTGGDTSIQTGNSTATNTVENQNINSNSVDLSGCGCNSGTTIAIANNGSDSSNNVDTTIGSSISVTQSNYAQIANNPQINANTGNNSANNNNGNTSITTGNILAKVIIFNKNINQNIDPEDPTGSKISIFISGNAADTLSSVDFIFENSFSYIGSNIADILNNPLLNLSTGGNEASDNNGDTSITTGDILAEVIISNDHINGNWFEEGKPQKGGENPGENNPPAIPPSVINPQIGGGGPNPDNSSNPNSVLASATGEILPTTGNNFLFLLNLLAIGLFFAGLYLRLHSGVAPPKFDK